MAEPPPADVALPAEEPATAGAPRASVAPRGAGWRDQVLGADAVVALAGLWLIASPLVFDYRPEHVALNPMLAGIVVALLAIMRMTGAWRSRALALLNVAVGLWLTASAFLFEAPIGGQWNQALMGGIVVLVALVGMAGAQRGRELHPER